MDKFEIEYVLVKQVFDMVCGFIIVISYGEFYVSVVDVFVVMKVVCDLFESEFEWVKVYEWQEVNLE